MDRFDLGLFGSMRSSVLQVLVFLLCCLSMLTSFQAYVLHNTLSTLAFLLEPGNHLCLSLHRDLLMNTLCIECIYEELVAQGE